MRKVMLAFSILLAGPFLLCAMQAWALDAKVYATLFGGDGVAVIDTSTLDVVGVIKPGKNPAKVVASRDGKYVYVSIYGEDKVAAIDTATDKEVKSVKVGKWPYALALASDGGRLLVGCMGDNSVWVIDTALFKEIGRIKTSDIPNDVKFSPDKKEAYVVNDTGPMQVFDLASMKQTATIDMPENVNQIIFSRSGGQLYYTSTAERKVTILDMEEHKTVKSFDALGDGLALSPDGSELWFGGPGSVIRVYSFNEDKVIAELPQVSEQTSLKIEFSGDGKRVFAGPAGEDGCMINVYDAVKKEKIGEIKLTLPVEGLDYIKK